MKKIIVFCLYSIIALSTIDIMCAEKRKRTASFSLNYILNSKEKGVHPPTSTQLVNQILKQELQNKTKTNNIVLSRSKKRKYIEKMKTLSIDNCNTPNGSEHKEGNDIQPSSTPTNITPKNTYIPPDDNIINSNFSSINPEECNAIFGKIKEQSVHYNHNAPATIKKNTIIITQNNIPPCDIIFNFKTVKTREEFYEKAIKYKNTDKRIGIMCDICAENGRQKCIYGAHSYVYQNLLKHRKNMHNKE